MPPAGRSTLGASMFILAFHHASLLTRRNTKNRGLNGRLFEFLDLKTNVLDSVEADTV